MILLYKNEAIKQLKRIGAADKQKAKKKIESLLTDPLLGKPLKGELGGLRSLKAWPLRIIYTFHPDKKTVTIITVDYRGNVYR